MIEGSAIAAMLRAPKTAARWSDWQPRSNHAGHLYGVAELIDQAGITMPGLTMQLEIKAAATAVSCLYFFNIMRLAGRERRRVYQLEVCPPTKRSHNGPVSLYGPHEHAGLDEPSSVIDPSVNCDSWDACLAWFLARTCITPIAIRNPFQP